MKKFLTDPWYFPPTYWIWHLHHCIQHQIENVTARREKMSFLFFTLIVWFKMFNEFLTCQPCGGWWLSLHSKSGDAAFALPMFTTIRSKFYEKKVRYFPHFLHFFHSSSCCLFYANRLTFEKESRFSTVSRFELKWHTLEKMVYFQKWADF